MDLDTGVCDGWRSNEPLEVIGFGWRRDALESFIEIIDEAITWWCCTDGPNYVFQPNEQVIKVMVKPMRQQRTSLSARRRRFFGLM